MEQLNEIKQEKMQKKEENNLKKTDFVKLQVSEDLLKNQKLEKKVITFLNVGKILGFEKIIFCLDLFEIKKICGEKKTIKEFLKDLKKRINEEIERKIKEGNEKIIGWDFGIVLKTDFNKNKEEQKKEKRQLLEVEKLKKNFIIIYDCNVGFDRNLFEKIKPHVLVNCELNPEILKDFVHQRNSGLNEAIVGFMKKKNIGYGISFNDIRKIYGDFMKFNLIIGKYFQNIKLLKDYDVGINIFSFAEKIYEMKNEKELKEFLGFLGVDSKTKKYCTTVCFKN